MMDQFATTGRKLLVMALFMAILSCGGEKNEDGDHQSADEADQSSNAGPSLASQIIGYWIADAEAMKAQALKDAGDDEQAKAMIPTMLAAMSDLTIEVSDSDMTIHMVTGPMVATYQVLREDKTSKTVTMEVADEGKAEKGTAMIDGDKMLLGRGSTEFALLRISKEEFDKRLAATESGEMLEKMPQASHSLNGI